MLEFLWLRFLSVFWQLWDTIGISRKKNTFLQQQSLFLLIPHQILIEDESSRVIKKVMEWSRSPSSPICLSHEELNILLSSWEPLRQLKDRVQFDFDWDTEDIKFFASLLDPKSNKFYNFMMTAKVFKDSRGKWVGYIDRYAVIPKGGELFFLHMKLKQMNLLDGKNITDPVLSSLLSNVRSVRVVNGRLCINLTLVD
eukprot:TRINITY_DN2540_c0_g1_i3.p1 TRINITY_DN2540_c0_g1~~TRINITY_DN2540_c0_g1_i3.p1  ORF type:complete len:198 (+),score=27.42 TRINITY_DN2540_c0_g1_i3:314-907(+)